MYTIMCVFMHYSIPYSHHCTSCSTAAYYLFAEADPNVSDPFQLQIWF